jgi:hypothetical protein
MTTANFCFYLQNRLIQTSQTGGQPYSDTSLFSIPWMGGRREKDRKGEGWGAKERERERARERKRERLRGRGGGGGGGVIEEDVKSEKC